MQAAADVSDVIRSLFKTACSSAIAQRSCLPGDSCSISGRLSSTANVVRDDSAYASWRSMHPNLISNVRHGTAESWGSRHNLIIVAPVCGPFRRSLSLTVSTLL